MHVVIIIGLILSFLGSVAPVTRAEVEPQFFRVPLAGTYDATVSPTVLLPGGLNMTCAYGKYLVGLERPIPMRSDRRLLAAFTQAIAYAYHDRQPIRARELRPTHLGAMPGLRIARREISYVIFPEVTEDGRRMASFMLMRLPNNNPTKPRP